MNIFSKKIGGKKGFTLAELLIVIAIIAILTAIAIPAFSASREKAQTAVYQANARAFHAECMSNYLISEPADVVTDATGTYDGIEYTWTLPVTDGEITGPATVAVAVDGVEPFEFDVSATDAGGTGGENP